MTSIQSYVILDLKQLGFLTTNYGELKITEISLLGVMKNHFDDSTPFRIPRVVNKLTMCFHPERFISCQSENITGLSNDLLEEQGTFDNNFCDILHNFVLRVPQPVCLLAHNGYRFDFPLIQAHTKILGRPLPEHILCADTWYAFKDLHIVEKEPPWHIPRGITHPFSPPPERVEDTDLWGKDFESELTSTALIKEVEKIERSVFEDCNGLTTCEALSKIYLNTPKRRSASLHPPPAPPRLKRHSVPQGKPSLPRLNTVRKELFHGNPTSKKPSYSLQAVYKHLFNRDIPLAHTAEGDTLAMLHCITALGTPFHEWVQANHRKLNSILKFW
uniref:Putative three prime repair exonuclease 1 n=1 Tax=Rhodnius prolixus TaxID=13249 RepID=R4G2U5_RHOPR